MNAYVVDTNVPVVANGKSRQADLACVIACVKQLQAIYNNGMVVLDDLCLILDEYRKHLGMSGQPGPGDGFMKWIWNNQTNPSRCEQVAITPIGQSQDDFEEFPCDPALVNFDRKDRKFVAVALASRNQPVIVNAVDSDWANYQTQLGNYGVRILQLCPQCCSQASGASGSERG
jgi:hypothetical protein